MKNKTRMRRAFSLFLILSFLAACSTSPDKISPSYVSPLQYQSYTCNQIEQEFDRLNNRVLQVTGKQRKEANKDAAAMGVGLILIWPALFFMIGDDKKDELARLKGECVALEKMAIQKECNIATEIEEARKQREKKEVVPIPAEKEPEEPAVEPTKKPQKIVAVAPVAVVPEEETVETPITEPEKDQQKKSSATATEDAKQTPALPEKQEDASTTSIVEEKNENLMASKEEVKDQEDQSDSLKSFLRLYCLTYESKDVDKFASFFALDALENNKPIRELLPKYRKNMEQIESFKYNIELIDYSHLADTDCIRVKGKYFIKYLLHDGNWKENNGNISMELAESGSSYLVKRLNYTSQSAKKVE